MGAMISHHAGQVSSLINHRFPGYSQHLQQARASFRPGIAEGQPPSWKKDDSRLHVDAFSSCPNHGERSLCVFTNITPTAVPRVYA